MEVLTKRVGEIRAMHKPRCVMYARVGNERGVWTVCGEASDSEASETLPFRDNIVLIFRPVS
jgi:hypothetical protein